MTKTILILWFCAWDRTEEGFVLPHVSYRNGWKILVLGNY